MTLPPLLEVDDLATSFRTEEGVVRAVDGVSFTLEAGQTLGLVGESGSGKSVTNLSILRLIPDPPGRIERGRILLAGRDLLKLSNEEMRHVRGRRVAMIFQDPMTSLNPLLTVSRQLTEVLELHEQMAPRTARERALEMLQRVGIPDAGRRLDAYPHQFSGGMRQRVMIAMALLCKPELLLADEPTTALDVTIQAQILTLLRTLSRELKTAVILVTHDLAVVAGMAQRVAVMYAGRIVEQADTATLFERPQHPYTIGLLRSLPARAATAAPHPGTGGAPDSAARADATGPGTSSNFGAAARAAGSVAAPPADEGSQGTDTPRRRLASIPGRPPSLARLPPGCPFAPRCPWAFDRCRAERPPLRATTAGSQAACWVEDPGTQPQAEPGLWEAGS